MGMGQYYDRVRDNRWGILKFLIYAVIGIVVLLAVGVPVYYFFFKKKKLRVSVKYTDPSSKEKTWSVDLEADDNEDDDTQIMKGKKKLADGGNDFEVTLHKTKDAENDSATYWQLKINEISDSGQGIKVLANAKNDPRCKLSFLCFLVNSPSKKVSFLKAMETDPVESGWAASGAGSAVGALIAKSPISIKWV
ncbi:MAG: hypothetical protein CMD68_00040 [Gammaproteobacteria bacterium]|nr:hypothetical protein [Gammaproteobacteria bacterium]